MESFHDDDGSSGEANLISTEVWTGETGDLPRGSSQLSMFEISFTVTFSRRRRSAEEAATATEAESVTLSMSLSLLLSVLVESAPSLRRAMCDVLNALGVRPPHRSAALVDEIFGCCDRIMEDGVQAEGRFVRVGVDIKIVVDELPDVGDVESELVLGFVDPTAETRFVAASEEAIEGLERVRVRVSDEKECVVCLEDILVGSEAIRMPCQHQFHGDCIVNWLSVSKFCPLCRFELPG